MAKKSADSSWPRVKQGSHLTVRTYEDGHTELEWDDEALLKDVRAAIMKFESAMNCVEVGNEVIERAKQSSKKTVAKKKAK